MEAFAEKMNEVLTPGIRKMIQESTQEAYRLSQYVVDIPFSFGCLEANSYCYRASFLLKFQFALDVRMDESQEAIIKEVAKAKFFWSNYSGR